MNPDGQQNARSYAVAVLAFSSVSVVVLVAILTGQAALPFARGLPGMGFPRQPIAEPTIEFWGLLPLRERAAKQS